MKKWVLIAGLFFFASMAMPGIAEAQVVIKIKPTPPSAPPAPPPPKKGYIWVKPYWKWSQRHQRYVWRPGHWIVKRPRQRWIPGHWRETRRGYIWIEGHWRTVYRR